MATTRTRLTSYQPQIGFHSWPWLATSPNHCLATSSRLDTSPNPKATLMKNMGLELIGAFSYFKWKLLDCRSHCTWANSSYSKNTDSDTPKGGSCTIGMYWERGSGHQFLPLGAIGPLEDLRTMKCGSVCLLFLLGTPLVDVNDIS